MSPFRMATPLWITVAALAACSSTTSKPPPCCMIPGINGGASTCGCPNDAGFSVTSGNGKCSILLTDQTGAMTNFAAGGQLVNSCPDDAGI